MAAYLGHLLVLFLSTVAAVTPDSCHSEAACAVEVTDWAVGLVQVGLQMKQQQTYANDSPGLYVITHEGTALNAEMSRTSRQVGQLHAGDVVNVVGVVANDREHRVRGYLEAPAGWISLKDTETGHRWAIKNADSGSLVSYSAMALQAVREIEDASADRLNVKLPGADSKPKSTAVSSSSSPSMNEHTIEDKTVLAPEAPSSPSTAVSEHVSDNNVVLAPKASSSPATAVSEHVSDNTVVLAPKAAVRSVTATTFPPEPNFEDALVLHSAGQTPTTGTTANGTNGTNATVYEQHADCPTAVFSQSSVAGTQATLVGHNIGSQFIFSLLDHGLRKMVLTDANGTTIQTGQLPDNSSTWTDPSTWAYSSSMDWSISNFLSCTQVAVNRERLLLADRSMGMGLFGFILFDIVLFYFASSRDKDVQQSAYFLLSTVVSLFITGLFFGVVEDWIETITISRIGEWAGILVHLAVFVALLFWVFTSLYAMKNGVNTAAVAMMGAHLVGYGGIESFGRIQMMAHNSLLTLDMLVLAFIIFFGMSYWLRRIRKKITEADGYISPAEMKFIEKCNGCEDEAFSFCLGFLISQSAKMSVIGRIPDIHGEPRGHSRSEVLRLVGWAIGFLVAMLIAAGLYQFETNKGWSRFKTRPLFYTQLIAGMAFGWTLLFAIEWQFFHSFPESSLAYGIISLAFIGTLAAIPALWILDKVADAGLPEVPVRGLMTIICTTVGISWGKGGHTALDAATNNITDATEGRLIRTLLAAVTMVILLPAWRFYFLPMWVKLEYEKENKDLLGTGPPLPDDKLEEKEEPPPPAQAILEPPPPVKPLKPRNMPPQPIPGPSDDDEEVIFPGPRRERAGACC